MNHIINYVSLKCVKNGEKVQIKISRNNDIIKKRKIITK